MIVYLVTAPEGQEPKHQVFSSARRAVEVVFTAQGISLQGDTPAEKKARQHVKELARSVRKEGTGTAYNFQFTRLDMV